MSIRNDYLLRQFQVNATRLEALIESGKKSDEILGRSIVVLYLTRTLRERLGEFTVVRDEDGTVRAVV